LRRHFDFCLSSALISIIMSTESWSSFHKRHQSSEFRQSSNGSLFPRARQPRNGSFGGVFGCLRDLVGGGRRQQSSRRNPNDSSPTIYRFHDEDVHGDLGHNFQ
jgi:hypothetical protein